MTKELTHRAEELKGLGWGQEDISRYIELWDYRQRWGAINLERDDRQFLRKAESLLPKINKVKLSIKKSLEEKSYYRWLRFYLEEMNLFETKDNETTEVRGLWPTVLEEEIRALEYYKPVLGLPDTIKAKSINQIREQLVEKALNEFSKDIEIRKFNYEQVLEDAKSKEKNSLSWRSVRDPESMADNNYPLLKQNLLNEFRFMVRKKLLPFIRDSFPSLSETDKPPIPDEWNP